MGNDLIALIVAITLGIVVVVLGWRRKLGETTRNWLPRFDRGLEQEPVSSLPPGGGQRRRQFSSRERKWAIGLYLMLAILNVSLALPGRDNRLLHVTTAALFAIAAVTLWLKKWPYSA